jgi:hypothetical protein
MANATDLNCTDSFTLPQGPRGDRGPIGATGPVGLTGAVGPVGPQGNSGASKIDLSFSSSTSPYVNITSTSYQDIGYFIFPGSTTFGTPQNVKFAVSSAFGGSTTDNLSVQLKVEDVTNPAAPTTVAEISYSKSFSASVALAGHTPEIEVDTTLLNIPTGESLFKISGLISKATKGDTARVYAFEMI